MISTLGLTVVLESAIVLAVCVVSRRPVMRLLSACLLVNLLTQACLWLTLLMFDEPYLAVLMVAEVFIWLAEGVLLSWLAGEWLSLRAAMALSAGMNLTSFGVGLLLPV